MTGRIKVDDKTQKVISAELDIDYAGHLKSVKADIARHNNIDVRVRRALKSIGVSDARPLKDADHKKIAAEKNAEALIKDFENAGFEITSAHYAYENALLKIESEETKGVKELFALAQAKSQARITELEKEIKKLTDELKILEDARKGFMKQIEAAIAPASNEFKKSVIALSADYKKSAQQYHARVWDFDTTRKYIKKK